MTQVPCRALSFSGNEPLIVLACNWIILTCSFPACRPHSLKLPSTSQQVGNVPFNILHRLLCMMQVPCRTLSSSTAMFIFSIPRLVMYTKYVSSIVQSLTTETVRFRCLRLSFLTSVSTSFFLMSLHFWFSDSLITGIDLFRNPLLYFFLRSSTKNVRSI